MLIIGGRGFLDFIVHISCALFGWKVRIDAQGFTGMAGIVHNRREMLFEVWDCTQSVLN